jgi:hypothetical protein
MSAVTGMSTAAAMRRTASNISAGGVSWPSSKPITRATAPLLVAIAG